MRNIASRFGTGIPASLSFCHDSGNLIVTGSDGGVTIHDSRNELREIGAFETGVGRTLGAAIDQRHHQVAVYGNGPIEIWDYAGRRPVQKLRFPGCDVRLPATDGEITAASWSGDGETLWATSSRETCVWTFHVATGRIAGRSPAMGICQGLSVCAVRGLLVGSFQDGEDKSMVKLWSLADPLQLRPVDSIAVPSAPISPAAFTPDGRRLVFVHERLEAFLYPSKVSTLTCAPHDRVNDRIADSGPGPGPAGGGGGRGRLWSAPAFSPDSNTFYIGSDSGHLIVTDVHGEFAARFFKAHESRVAHVALSPDGGLAATACADGEIKLWDVQG